MSKLLIIAIVAAVVFVILTIYSISDQSKDSKLERKKSSEDAKAFVQAKIWGPVYDFFDTHTKPEKKAKIQDRYNRAGFRKMNFATNIIFCLILSFALAIIVGIVSNNPFLGIVFFGIGWNIPGLFTDFVANRRIEKLNDQVGMFLRMVIKRYQVVGDFYFAFSSTIEDFEGEDPMYSELVQTMANINRGDSIDDALHELAHRMNNKYMRRFADYYAITADIGTQEAKNVVLEQALEQYQEHMELSRSLKKQLSELTMEAYIMLAFVPCVVVYQCVQDPSYIPFMTQTLLGKAGSAIFAAV